MRIDSFLLLLVVATVLSIGGSQTIAGNHTAASLYPLCLGNPLCQTVFQQKHGELSYDRFAYLAGNAIAALNAASPEDLLITYPILYQTLYAEQRCPPNTYWHWESDVTQGRCRCYIDCDCRINDMHICFDSLHPILIYTLIFLGIILFAVAFCFNRNPTTESRPVRRKHA